MFDFEEREPNELNLVCLVAQASRLLRSWRSSRRPRSPSSNHNVKELNLARILILPEKHHRPQDRVSPAAWAAYIGARICSVKYEIEENFAFL
jgi:hypothetical protein